MTFYSRFLIVLFACLWMTISTPTIAQSDGDYVVITPENVDQLVLLNTFGRGAVSDIAYWDDTTAIATSRGIWLYDNANFFDEPRLFKPYDSPILALAYHPTDHVLAIGMADARIALWDITGEKLIRWLGGEVDKIQCMTISPDGQRIGIRTDVALEVRDILTNDLIMSLKELSSYTCPIQFSADNTFIFGVSQYIPTAFNITTDEVITSPTYFSSARSFAYSPDMRYIASGWWDGVVRIWDVETWEVVQELSRHDLISSYDGVNELAYSADGKTLISVSLGSLHVWDIETGVLRFAIPLNDKFMDFTYNPDMSLITIHSHDSIQIWDGVAGIQRHQTNEYAESVEYIAYSPDGQHLAASSYAFTRIWSTERGTVDRILYGSGELHYISEERLIGFISLGEQSGTELVEWNLQTGDLIGTPDSRIISSPLAIAYSPDSQFMAFSDIDEVTLLNLQTGEVRLSGELDFNVNSLSYSADGQYLLFGPGIILWDVSEFAEVYRIRDGYDGTFSPDNLKIAYLLDNIIYIIDRATGDIQQVLEGHSNRVHKLLFSPDGRLLISFSGGRNDNTMQIWSTETGDLLSTTNMTEAHWGVRTAFSPDGRFLAIAQSDGTIQMWGINPSVP